MINIKEVKEVKEVEVVNWDLGLGNKSKLLIMNDGTQWLENRGTYTASGVMNYYTDASKVKVIDGKYDMSTARREEKLYKSKALEIDEAIALKIF